MLYCIENKISLQNMVSDSVLLLLVNGATELHYESHWDVIKVHHVNENEDKILLLLEKLKLLANIGIDRDVLFKVE